MGSAKLEYTLNETYKFEIKNVSFGDIPPDRILDFYKDGRVASFFLEEQLPHWFAGLTRIEGNKDHDHIDAQGREYDAKNFTRNGLKFMPSNQMGAGRRFNESMAHEKASKLIYICCDIVDFPHVRVKFVKGEDLIKEYPKCSVPFSRREGLFGAG